MQNVKLQFKEFFVFLIFVSCFLFSTSVDAAVIYFSPEVAEYSKGDIFISELRINTEGKIINSLEATISFNPVNLEVLDISHGDSILNLWPQAPVFSNHEGNIFFVGGIPKEGFLGDGKIVSIVFRAIGEGYNEMLLQNKTMVLLNDGLGTATEIDKKIAKFVIFPQGTEIPTNEWKNLEENDKTPPEKFLVLLEQNSTMFDGKYFLVFSAIDNQTGIDRYEIKEGNSDWQIGDSPYLLEDQKLNGKILVKAVDKAQNERIEKFISNKDKLNQIMLLILILVIGLAGMIFMYFKTIKKLGKQN